VSGARTGLAALAAVVSLARVAAAEPYVIDHAKSEIVVRVFRAGLAAFLAHDHVIRAAEWDGTLDVNRDPPALAADLRVPVDALVVDEPEARARHGLDGVLSEDDRASVRATMLGPEQLDAARFPEIRFRAAEIDRAGKDFRLAGELTLHGETKRITLPITVRDDAGTLTAHGTVRVVQSDFGITPHRALLGAIKNQDEVEIVVTVVAAPAATR
jgi:polyisoprenoid-binding protein YceI